jgi:hypothetical protein
MSSSSGTIIRLVWSMGRVRSSVPWVMKNLGDPAGSTASAKPGEKADPEQDRARPVGVR